jgi:hypothetical protein
MHSAMEREPLLTLRGRRLGIGRERPRIKRQLAKIQKELTGPEDPKTPAPALKPRAA